MQDFNVQETHQKHFEGKKRNIRVEFSLYMWNEFKHEKLQKELVLRQKSVIEYHP